MKRTILRYRFICLIICALLLTGCDVNIKMSDPEARSSVEYSDELFPLERNGIELYLDRVSIKDADPEKNILLIHGVTYSSHEFDIDYQDYSLVRALAKKGYGVWRLDIAGIEKPYYHTFQDKLIKFLEEK